MSKQPALTPLPPYELVSHRYQYWNGGLFWKISCGAGSPGTPATLVKHGAKIILIKNQPYYEDRLIWLLLTKEDPIGFSIRHIDGDWFNNRFDNLYKVKFVEYSTSTQRLRRRSFENLG